MQPIDFLKLAIEESRFSVLSGSSPFGAIIVKNGVIIAKAHNQVIAQNDPTAHAEILCIRNACQKLGSYDLTGCILYSSCEPCPMCLNAAKWANIKTIYYAATRRDADVIGFRDKVFYENTLIQLNHIELDSARTIMDEWAKMNSKKPY